jgi:hypothetical protein
LKLSHKFKNHGIEGLDGLNIFITWFKDLGNLVSNFKQLGFKCCHSWWQIACIATLP